jgi:hypothetical protein
MYRHIFLPSKTKITGAIYFSLPSVAILQNRGKSNQHRERKNVPLLAQNKMPLSLSWTPLLPGMATADDVGFINDDPGPHHFDHEVERNLFDSNTLR